MLEISLETLKKAKITAHQFLILKLVTDRKFSELEYYLTLTNSIESLKKDLTYLENIKMINKFDKNNPMDFKWITVNINFFILVSEGDYFEEFYNMFPIKVYRPNGTIDYLRSDRSHCKKLYINITKRNKSKHEHILKCLNFEIKEREATGTLPFMKRMVNWLTSEEWKSIEDRLSDSTDIINKNNKTNMPYGTELK